MIPKTSMIIPCHYYCEYSVLFQKVQAMRVANESEELFDNMSAFMNINPQELKMKTKSEIGSLENGEITKFYFQKLIKIECSLAFIISISMLLILMASEINYSDQHQEKTHLVNFCLSFNCACSFIASNQLSDSVLVAIMRAVIMLNLEKKRKAIYQSTSLFSTKRAFFLFLECVIILIQPYPMFTNSLFETYNSLQKYTFLFPLNDLLTIFSLFKIVIIFRGLILLTPYMNNRCTRCLIIANRLCKMYGAKADFLFALKCLFRDNPLLLIVILFCTSTVSFGYAVFLAERDHEAEQCEPNAACTFLNAIWLILMTITTVGYGDYYPQTPLGRVIIFLVAIWGTFIVSIMVVVVANTLKMQKKQKQAGIVIEKLDIRSKLQRVGGFFIGYSCLYKNACKKKDWKAAQQWQTKMKKMKNQFSQVRKKLKQIHNEMDLYDEIATNFLNLNSDIDILNENQAKIINFIHEKLEYKGICARKEHH